MEGLWISPLGGMSVILVLVTAAQKLRQRAAPAGLQRLQRSAGADGYEKQRLAELAGGLEGLAAAARQLLHP